MAEPAAKVALEYRRRTTEMRAYADEHEPFRLLRAIEIGRRRAVGKSGIARVLVGQLIDVHRARLGDLPGRAMTNEQRVPAPFEDDLLAKGDRGDIELGCRERKNGSA